jgi:uncharacterized protein
MDNRLAGDVVRVVAAKSDIHLEPVGQRPGADRGDPQVSLAVIYEGPKGLSEVGVWECTPGGWPIRNRSDTEICHIVLGRAVLTGDDGARQELGPGDTAVLPVGWSGRWDVVETVRKVYVVIQPQTS